MIAIEKRRFDALAGYIRSPLAALTGEELEWYSAGNDRVLGIVLRDRSDHDFGWIILARDRLHRYRGINLAVSIATRQDAREKLEIQITKHATAPDHEFYQGDEQGRPIDFFTPVVPRERLHRSFVFLSEDEKYSPARELISAMMRYYSDIDGNFIEQFQTTGFDTRLWELYLFAVLVELGYARRSDSAVPDFVGAGILGMIGVEAVTANPPQTGTVPSFDTPQKFTEYLQNYIPIKLAKGLTRKLRRKPPYWAEPEMIDTPFVIGIQDFHSLGSMRMIVPAITEYVFGFRHSLVDGQQRIETIAEHRFGNLVEPSGFFELPNSENVAAVITNPQGTLMKFNRMGFTAGFGSSRLEMIRTGILRREGKSDGPYPRPFSIKVTRTSPETWVEGMVVLHNPRAKIPLLPDQLPGANHEFLQPDGKILSMVPDFHPYFSQTTISILGEENASSNEE